MRLPFNTALLNHKPVDLRRLRQFVVVAETLNFRQAAQILHIAQPPLSIAIQKLELDLGTPVFTRGKGGVILTENGHVVLEEAKRLLYSASLFQEAVSASRSGTRGLLNVGFVGSTTYGLLQTLTTNFRQQYNDIKLILREDTTKDIIEQVEIGKLDIGLIRTPIVQSTHLSLVPLIDDHFVAAIPSKNSLIHHDQLSITDLASVPFIMYNEENAAGLHVAVTLAFQHKNCLPQVAQEATQIQTVLALVESGLGVAMIPAIMRRFVSNQIVYRPIYDLPKTPKIGLGLVYRSDQESGLSLRFRELAAQLNACSSYPEEPRSAS